MDIKEYQHLLFDMLCDFDLVCKEYDLQYFLYGGSALGAIRHKGFIPWDDDVDIVMPRPDYVKFINSVSSKMNLKYKVIYRNNACVHHLVNTELEIEFRTNNVTGGKGNLYYPFIDIFPLDGAPNNRLLRHLLMDAIILLKCLFKLGHIQACHGEERSKIIETIIKIAKIIHTEKWFPTKIFEMLWVSLAQKISYKDSSWVMCAFSVYRHKDIFPMSWVEPKRITEFEGKFFPVFHSCENYLKQTYGDYMTPIKHVDHTHL